MSSAAANALGFFPASIWKPHSAAETPARAALRAAMNALPGLAAAAREAQARAEQVEDMTRRAEASLGAFDGFDEQLAAYHQACVRTHADPASASLPAALVELRRSRTEARERLAEFKAFAQAMQQEAAAETAAIGAVAAARRAVFQAVADARAERLAQVEAWCGRERLLLCDAADALSLTERAAGPNFMGALVTPWSAMLMDAV